MIIYQNDVIDLTCHKAVCNILYVKYIQMN